MEKDLKKLTGKQTMFVKEYLVDLNATQAAIRAGYNPKRAYSMGWENLKKPEIDVAIQKAMIDRGNRTEITADKVLTDIELIKADAMRLDTAGFMIDRPSALKGCELQGRNLKMWTDKVEFPGGLNIGAISVKINHIYPNSQKSTPSDRSGDAIEVRPKG